MPGVVSFLVTAFKAPATGSAEVSVLHSGYVGLDGDGERVSGTVTLIVDGGSVTVVDPGMVASTPDGIYVCTHAWWSAAGPETDPLGTDQAALAASRELLLSFANVIIPGHGEPFRPGALG